jgi:hypothetical protein
MLKEEIKKHPLGRVVSHWEKAMSNFFVNYGATFNLDICVHIIYQHKIFINGSYIYI